MRESTVWSLIFFFLIAICSCRMVGRVERSGETVVLQQYKSPSNKEKEILDTIIVADEPQKADLKNNDSNGSQYTMVRVDENGDPIFEVNLDKIDVISHLKIVPEREGKVFLNFNIIIPKKFQSKDWRVVVNPYLHIDSVTRPLEPLAVMGSVASLLQERDYWQYQKIKNRMIERNGGSGLTHAQQIELDKRFEELITHPKMSVTRLDSIVTKGELLVYHYVQEVNTKDIPVSHPLYITTNGEILAIDRSYYRMAIQDTLIYNIASMLSFIDNSPRFISKIVEKYKRINVRHNIVFEQGKSTINKDLNNNSGELERFSQTINKMLNLNEYDVDSIILVASSSPEGRFEYNRKLSDQRGKELKEYIVADNRLDDKVTLKVRSLGENWPELISYINTDPQVKEKDKILKGISRYRDYDEKEFYMRQYCKNDFKYIEKHLYPKLRMVDVRYYLRHKRMTKDTIYTTELDRMYMRGVELLKKRNYQDALSYLSNYECRNKAIIYLSLGYDKAAKELLVKLKPGPSELYLLSVALIRLGELEAAKKKFEEACKLAPHLKYRENVDPEITKIR